MELELLYETHRLESGHLGGLLEVVQAVLHIVDGHSTVHAIEAGVGQLRDTLVRAIPGLEISVTILSSDLRREVSGGFRAYRTAVQ